MLEDFFKKKDRIPSPEEQKLLDELQNISVSFQSAVVNTNDEQIKLALRRQEEEEARKIFEKLKKIRGHQ